MTQSVKYKYTKKHNKNTKKKNKTKKKHQKQKGGNNDDLNMIVRDEPLDALKKYVSEGGDINKKGSKGITALMEATSIFDISKITYLIEQGADVNAVADDGTTAYSLAFGNDEIVNLLKEAGANTNHTYLLLLAIEKNNTKTAKAMINNREALSLNINEQVGESTALYKAVENGNSEIVKMLLEAGANPNSHNGQASTTPIIKAAQNRDLNMVEILFEANADPLLEDATNTDAVYTAYNNHDIAILNYFAAKDVDTASTLLNDLEPEVYQDAVSFPPPPPAQQTDIKTVVQQIQPAPINNPPFYDVVNMVDTDMKTYLEEHQDNIILIYNQQILGTDKARIQHEITSNRTKVMLECKDPNTYFRQPEENIVKDEENNLLYYLNMDIVGLAGVYLPISELKTVTESLKSRIFFISTLEDKPHKEGGHVITSFGSYDGDNVVSAKHCAENEPIKFGKLYAI